MAPRKTQRTVYLVTAAIVVAMVGGYALAATATTTLTNPQGSSQGTTTPGGLIAGYSWTNSELVVLLVSSDLKLGTSTGAGNALGGTQLALTGCAFATVFSEQPAGTRPDRSGGRLCRRDQSNGNTRNRCAGKWSRNANRGDLYSVFRPYTRRQRIHKRGEFHLLRPFDNLRLFLY